MADPLDLWRRVVGARWRTGLLVFGGLNGAAVALVFLTRPVYRAEARLRIGEPPPQPGVPPGAGVLGLFRAGGDPFANDLELLRSRTVTERTVLDAALSVSVAAPRGWFRDSLFTSLTASRATAKARYAVHWLPTGRIVVRMEAPRDSLVGEVSAGEPLSFGGLTASFRAWREGAPRAVVLRTLPFGEAVRRTRPRLHAERTRRDANVADLWFQDRDPGLARDALQAAVQRFVELRSQVLRRESGATVDSLRLVAEDTRRQLRHAEEEVAALQKDSALVAPSEQLAAAIQEYGRQRAELLKVQTELAGLKALLARVDSISEPARAWTELVSHPRFLENPTVGTVFGQLMSLEQRRLELASRRAASSREMTILTEQMAAADRSLRQLAAGYREGLEQTATELEAGVAALENQLAAIPQRGLELARRQREARLLSELLVLAEQRLGQEELRQALSYANVQVIDPPALRFKPVWPRKGLGLGAGMVLAILGAGLAMAAAERADRSVRRAGELEALLGQPVLALAVRRADGSLEAGAPDLVRAFKRVASGSASAEVLVIPVGSEQLADEIASTVNRVSETADGLRLVAGPAVEGLPQAIRAVRDGLPVVLAVECHRSTYDAVARTAALVRRAGAQIEGAVVVTGQASDGREFFA